MAETFGKYFIEKKLGQGGMGSVYLATDPLLNRKVALKVISAAAAGSQELIERFQREAQAVAKLKHPNIVQVYEAGLAGQEHYIALEYIDGAPLDGLIKSRAAVLTPKNVARIMLQAAQALDFAHNHGVIHRDIKPANILIERKGRVCLADFGLAKQLSGLDRSLTMSGTAMGTPEFMSPEQALGRTNEVDARSDIFSLGATMYQCLTFQSSVQGNDLYDTLRKVINDDPPAPSTIVRGLDRRLETICLKCLNKDRARRYRSAGELAGDLKRYLEGGGISARRTGYLVKIWQRATRNPLAAVGIAGAGLIILISLGWWLVLSAQTTNKVEQYRREANNYYAAGDWNDALAACENALTAAPLDAEMSELRDKCRTEIIRKQKSDEQAKANTEIRLRAKAVLDRASGNALPDNKIAVAREALAIDPDFGDAYQVIGYAYKAKAAEGGLSRDEYRELYDKSFKAFTRAIELTPTLAYSYYERGWITAEIQGDKAGAANDYEKVLQYDPNSYIGYFARAEIEYNQGKTDEAIADYTRGLDIFPDHMESLGNRGNLYLKKGEYQLAIENYNRAMALRPNDPKTYYNRGFAYFNMGELAKSVADYTKAIRLKADYTEAYLGRSKAYGKLKDYQAAIADVETALKIEPKNPEALNFSIMTFHWKVMLAEMTVNQKLDTLEKCNEAIQLNPKNTRAYFDRALIYDKNKQTDLAIADYDMVIKLEPDNFYAYVNRGIAYRTNNELERAVADFTGALLIKPDETKAYRHRAEIYTQQGKLDIAIADYNALIRLKPDVNGYMDRGTLFGMKQDYDNAIADFKTAIELAPDSGSAFYNLGAAYRMKNDADAAIKAFNRAIELNPKYSKAFYQRAAAYENKGDLKHALADLDRSIELDKMAYSYIQRGVIYRAQGNYKQALADLSEAVKLDPACGEAYAERARTYAAKRDFKTAVADGETALKLGIDKRLEVGLKMEINGWKRAMKK